MKLYHELAEYYFSIEEKYRDIKDDITLIKSLLKNKVNPLLLDLGCGTGEHLHCLSKLGVNCTGIDTSNSMIKIAKLRSCGQAEFIKEDMKNINFFEKFDIVISLFGSLNYMIEDKDVDRVLMNTWDSLRPKGIGLFEIWNSLPIRKIKEKPLDYISTTKYNNLFIERKRGFKLLDYPVKTIADVRYTYTLSHGACKKQEIIEDQHIIRAFSKEEIELFILKNGFTIHSIYADALKEPYKDLSNRIIIHFEKSET